MTRPIRDISEPTVSDKTRFMSKVVAAGPDDCWGWLGCRNTKKYGLFAARTPSGWRMIYAHRFAYLLNSGQIDAKLCVLHSCDNPFCVNPKHLRQGSTAENHQDMIDRHREPLHDTLSHPGENSPMAKLTEIQVLAIRQDYLGGSTQMSLARRYGVAKSLIWSIVTGRSWQHLPVHKITRINTGERNGSAKLTADAVRAIRAEHASQGTKIPDLAKRYSVSHATMRDVVTGHHWRHAV